MRNNTEIPKVCLNDCKPSHVWGFPVVCMWALLTQPIDNFLSKHVMECAKKGLNYI